MNIFTIILEVTGAFVVLLLLVGLFTRKDYAVLREVTINRSVSEVFNYLRFLKNQDHFSKWVMMDLNMKKIFRGTDGTVGFVYGWNGNKQAGEGEQEIMGIEEGKLLDVEVRFVRPFAAIAKTPFKTEQISADQTKVTWGMSSQMKYPMNVMLLFMDMDKLLGKDLETSLGTLKEILEKK